MTRIHLLLALGVLLGAACVYSNPDPEPEAEPTPAAEDEEPTPHEPNDDGWDGNDSEGDGGGWTSQPQSSYAHTLDGGFTDWSPDLTSADHFEWFDVQPLTGVYTHLYLDYGGDQKLHILNDWHYNDVYEPSPDCYNEFDFVGFEVHLNIKVFGDQHVEATLNGEPAETEVGGGASFGRSPLVPDRDHAIWELAITVPPDVPWSCQLHDPGPTTQSSCDELETEPTVVEGTTQSGGLVLCGFLGPVIQTMSVDAAEPGAPLTLRLANAKGPIEARFDDVFAPLFATGVAGIYTTTVPAHVPGIHLLTVVRTDDNKRSRALPFEIIAVYGDDTGYDADGDGWGVDDGDCMDNNPWVHPAQTEFFTSDRGDGSYDYDCDGSEEMFQPALATCGFSDECTGPTAGWCVNGCEPCAGCAPAGTVPACGDVAGLRTEFVCTWREELGACMPEGLPTPTIQSCR